MPLLTAFKNKKLAKTIAVLLVACSLMALSASIATPAEALTPVTPVTPWQKEIDEAQRLMEEAAKIGKYRYDAKSDRYVGGCAGEQEKAQIRLKLERAIELGRKIRDYYGQAQQGQYIIDVITRQLEYAMSLPPCVSAPSEVEEVESETTTIGVPSAAPSLGQVGAGLAFGAIGSLGYAMYSTARAAKSFGPRRPRPRRPPRGPIVSTYPWRPGRPFYSPPRPKGPQYAPAPPPPPTPSVPPSPIEPGGQPTGGAGIQGPTPYIPRAPVQNVRVAWPPGGVSLEWDPPKYNPEEYELLGYNIYRLIFTGRSTVAEREWLDQLPPGQNNWQGPHRQTYQYHEAGDIEGYIVEPIYRVLRRGDPYQGNVVPGDGTRASARYIH